MRITVELLRRRAEHNSGVLRTLEELTLHQFDIREIEVIDEHCRMLKILYLQNNKISEIQRLSKLKRLEYLNLSLNCIHRISGLRGCESLRKLDLTLNAIAVEDLLQSLKELSHNDLLLEVHLRGNPCAKWEHYRALVIGSLPQLKWLDGREITDEERTESLKTLEHTLELYQQCLKERSHKREEEMFEEIRWIRDRLEDMDDVKDEMEEKRKEMEKEERTLLERDPLRQARISLNQWIITDDDSSVMALPKQRNMPRVQFDVNDDPKSVSVVLKTSKHVSTSQIRTQIMKDWFQCSIKGDLFVMHLPCEVDVSESRVFRARVTGFLHFEMPKLKKGIIEHPHSDPESEESSDFRWDRVPDLV